MIRKALRAQAYETNSYEIKAQHRVERNDPYFQEISTGWGDALRNAFQSLPDFHFDGSA